LRSIQCCIRPWTGRICACGPIPEPANNLYNSVAGECDTGDGKLYAGVGDFRAARAATGGDYIELAWDEEHYTYQLYGTDTLASAAAALANSINTFSQTMQASANGAAITLTLANSSTGDERQPDRRLWERL
jgi:hypothetical protein